MADESDPQNDGAAYDPVAELGPPIPPPPDAGQPVQPAAASASQPGVYKPQSTPTKADSDKGGGN